MASYGTITGTCSNREANYTAQIYWKIVSQSIENNTTTIAVWSGVVNDGSSYNWNGTCSSWALTVNGQSSSRANFTSNSAAGYTWSTGLIAGNTVFSTSRTHSLLNASYPWHEEFVIPHNSDGTKSINISHSYSLLSGGAGPGNVNITGTAVLDTIPRASVINSFSAPNNLRSGYTNNISLSLTRYSTSFTHDISLYLGTNYIASWNAQTLPTSLALSSNEVDTILSYMPTTTSATLTLKVQTKSGSTNIGGVVSKTSLCYISSLMVPDFPTPTIAEANSLVSNIPNMNAYVNKVSILNISCGAVTPSNYGVSTISYVLNYQGNSININPTTGQTYTTGPINWDGTTPTSAQITLTATDSRKRSKTITIPSLTALPYAVPKIDTFTATRQTTATTIQVIRKGSVTSLMVGGAEKNTIKAEIYKRASSDSWSSPYWTEGPSSNLEIINDTQNNLSNDITLSYEFMFVLTDRFNQTVSYVTVPASGVESILSIGTKSIAIGKFIDTGEPYTLDVNGTAKISSNTTIGGTLASSGAITQAGTPVSLTTHTHDIFTLIETKTISTNQAFTTAHGTYQYRDFLTFTNYTPSANGTVMINLNVNGYYGVVTTSYGFARGKVYIRNSSTANSSSGIIETYSAILFPTGSGTYDPQIFSTGSFFMNVNSGTTYRFKISSYGDNINGGIGTESKASLYFIPRI